MTRTYVPNNENSTVRMKLKRDASGEYTVLRQDSVGSVWVPIGSIWNNAATYEGDWAYCSNEGDSQGFQTLSQAIYWVVNEGEGASE